jgi:hypothetical protein
MQDQHNVRIHDHFLHCLQPAWDIVKRCRASATAATACYDEALNAQNWGEMDLTELKFNAEQSGMFDTSSTFCWCMWCDARELLDMPEFSELFLMLVCAPGFYNSVVVVVVFVCLILCLLSRRRATGAVLCHLSRREDIGPAVQVPVLR